jgi:hypothetical protein
VASAVYLDASAVVKTVVAEPESARLRRFLRGYEIHASSALSRAEALRAVRGAEPAAVPRVREAMNRLVLLEVSDSVLEAAGLLEPVTLRTLDAIHLASALTLAGELAAVITYDRRMAEAAAAVGLPLAAPA